MNFAFFKKNTYKSFSQLGRYAHPIFTPQGDYPQVMRNAIDAKSSNEGRRWSRLPRFTLEQVESLRGSADFLALNYYTSSIVTPFSMLPNEDPNESDEEIAHSIDPSWPQSASNWLFQVPEGFYQLLVWIKNNYNNPLVYITENGWSDEPNLIEDDGRVDYLKTHLAAMSRAINNDNCNVKAYTVWSLIDNFEWMQGYTERFGIYAINFTDPERTRIPKKSVQLFKDLIRDGFIDV